MGATRAELRARIQKRYGETGTTWTEEDEINQWIQEAHDYIAEQTSYSKDVQYAQLVAYQDRYDVSDLAIVAIEDVLIAQSATETRYYRIEPIPWMDYLANHDGQDGVGNTGRSGTPTSYCLRGKYLYVDPAPDYTTTGDNTTYTYGIKLMFATRPVMDEDTDETDLPPTYEKLVVWYGLAEWCGKDGRPDREQFYRQKLDAGIAEFMGKLKRSRAPGARRHRTDEEVTVREL